MATAVVPATREAWASRGPVDTHYTGASSTVMYVNKVATDGWLQAKDDATSALVPLFLYTTLSNVRSKGGRTYFKVEEGGAKGKTLSLSDANAKTYLGDKAPSNSGVTATVTYGKYVKDWESKARGGQKINQQMATLTIGSLTVAVTMNSDWDHDFYPLPAGEYTILLPDVPHTGAYTRFYRDTEPKLIHDQVWFPIKYGDNSRYIHVGNVSDGCTTVLDLAKWSDVHKALISHRQDSKSVGKLVIKGKPERAK